MLLNGLIGLHRSLWIEMGNRLLGQIIGLEVE